MRNTILLLLLVPFTLFSQATIDSVNQSIYLRQVHEIGLSKQELKKKANEWVARSFKNSNYVTRINNADQILTKGAFSVGADFTAYGTTIYVTRDINYTLDLQFKQGRYKIEIIDLSMSTSGVEIPFIFMNMDFEGYRDYSRKALSELEMPGTKAALKRLNNDKKARKDYEGQKDHYDRIFPQIVDEIESIDSSLLSYMNSESTADDDW